MAIRIYTVLCITILFFAYVEARWHNLKLLRKHRDEANVELEDLINGPEDYSELTKSDEEYLRRRPALSKKEEADTEETYASEEYKGDDYGLRRLLDHRRRRSHPPTRHSHRHHHDGHKKLTESDPMDLAKEHVRDELLKNHARGKRHNGRRVWTEKERESFKKSRLRPVHYEDDTTFEVEVREAQNSSLCNYTVVPIPDPGGRIPRDLEHIKCNHVGSRCQDKGSYCCLQTFRNVEVMYEGGKRDVIKVYSGCVCSLQIYGTLEVYSPELDIND